MSAEISSPGDPYRSDLVLAAAGATPDSGEGLLAAFNRAGVLTAADVHVALRLCRLGGHHDRLVALGAALAVRGPRYGHVYADLTTARDTVAPGGEDDADVDSLAWPDPERWLGALRASPLVAVGDEDGDGDGGERPLRLVGSALYLDRYWRDERAVAADLLARCAGTPPPVDEGVLAEGLGRLFAGPGATEQRWAAATAVLSRLAVVAGGPGTGKTTTVARVLALLDDQAAAAGDRPPLVALAAPTGKAAARLEEAVHAQAALIDVGDATRQRLLAAGASTIHRLLGARPGNSGRFRHDRFNQLPHDVVVVDETSMVALSIMARLTEAVRPDARLLLVGDPEQLASVEAGAVLGDIAGPALGGMCMREAARSRLARVAPPPPPTTAGSGEAAMGDGVVVLRANHRFHGVLAEFAAAVRAGRADGAIDLLARGDPALCWADADLSTGDAPTGAPSHAASEAPSDAAADRQRAVEAIRQVALPAGSAVVAAAAAGDGTGALAALEGFRLLCAHRRGPAGVAAWTQRVEQWLAAEVEGFDPDGPWYVGRPLVVNANDYSLRLYNGDAGVTTARPGGGVAVAFPRGGSLRWVSPSRLAGVDTVFAMTVHKAQGSEFAHVAVVLPPPESPVLTRELLYTAVTRARHGLTLAGSEAQVRAAVDRPISRASGLTGRLWDQPAPTGANRGSVPPCP